MSFWAIRADNFFDMCGFVILVGIVVFISSVARLDLRICVCDAPMEPVFFFVVVDLTI